MCRKGIGDILRRCLWVSPAEEKQTLKKLVAGYCGIKVDEKDEIDERKMRKELEGLTDDEKLKLLNSIKEQHHVGQNTTITAEYLVHFTIGTLIVSAGFFIEKIGVPAIDLPPINMYVVAIAIAVVALFRGYLVANQQKERLSRLFKIDKELEEELILRIHKRKQRKPKAPSD